MNLVKLLKIIGLFLFFTTVLTSQNYYNVRLQLVEQTNPEQACYTIQLASAQAADLSLAGQNYRLYYDATRLKYNEASIKNVLPSVDYTAARLKEHLFDIDASGVGQLPCEKHLAFLNIGIDLKNVLKGGIVLPASGAWQNTLQICFDYLGTKEQELLPDKMGIYWAREELTENYATAFVEVAEWVAPHQTHKAIGANYYDTELSIDLSNNSLEASIKIYPNPTKDKVWIEYKSQTNYNLQVWSVNGQLIVEEELDLTKGLFNFNLENQPAGMYQIRIANDKQLFTKQIEKIH